ncbi:MAG: hypothetical protein WBA41_02175 [Rivularia sp. (in: cyanobacteria)]
MYRKNEPVKIYKIDYYYSTALIPTGCRYLRTATSFDGFSKNEPVKTIAVNRYYSDTGLEISK